MRESQSLPIPQRVLLLTSIGEEASRVRAYCGELFDDVQWHSGNWGDPTPDDFRTWNGDLVVSYCSRWIVPSALLENTGRAINFHPAPPTRRGAGGINWALYENAVEYGVTCHEIDAQLDAGPILEVRRFPVLDTDDVCALYARTHGHLEEMARRILKRIAMGESIAPSGEQWSGVVRTRAELDQLSTLSADMDLEEMSRRIRATSFGSWQPVLSLHEWRFVLSDGQ